MKKLLSLLFILWCSPAFAERPKDNQPAPNNYSSLSCNNSSNTATVTSTSNVIISSYPATIHTVIVNTIGIWPSKLEIFNSQLSTSVKYADGKDLQKLCAIDTSSNTKTTYIYDVFFDSGISWANQGNTPADVTITYRER